MGLDTNVQINTWYAKIDPAPIFAVWVGISKGDPKNPNCGSRLASREINAHKRDDLFVGTPPLEVLRVPHRWQPVVIEEK